MAPRAGRPRCAVGPDSAPAWLVAAAEEGGAEITDVSEAEALVWHHADAALLAEALALGGDGLRWVSLPAAGIERWAELVDDRRIWTAAKGVYADPVAEAALALGLAGLRNIAAYARAAEWSPAVGANLLDADVVVVGGGGIATALLRLLEPFRARVTVVRRHPGSMPGAARVVGPEDLDAVLPGAALVVLAVALTPETRGLFGRTQLSAMGPNAWLVNVSRGGLVVTDELVAALVAGELGGAALDVTDPEPLPGGHPLWSLENCLITPHMGNTKEMHRPLLAGYVRENVRRFATGEPLIGVVDPALGY